VCVCVGMYNYRRSVITIGKIWSKNKSISY